MENKADLIEKGTGGITKLTNAAHYKTLAFCLVISLIVNFWQGYSNSKLTSEIIKQNNDLNEKRVQEIKSMVQQEVEEKIQPIKLNVESATKKVDTVIERIDNETK